MNEKDFKERLKSTGRNEQCPCGSGKKYKKCHLPEDEALHQKEIERQKETAGEERADGAGDRHGNKPSHYNDTAKPKVKLSKTVARLNVPRRQAGK